MVSLLIIVKTERRLSLCGDIMENIRQYTSQIVSDNFKGKEESHGEQDIRQKNCLKLLYYCCLFVLIVTFAVRVGNSVDYFLREPTYTESHLVRQSHAEFPAMSICSDSGGFKEDVLQVMYLGVCCFLN